VVVDGTPVQKLASNPYENPSSHYRVAQDDSNCEPRAAYAH
jgi:hypothetical protein